MVLGFIAACSQGAPLERAQCIARWPGAGDPRHDTYGHVFGDQVLRVVAQVLGANVKGQDTAARIGGEEFAILLPATPLAGAQVLAGRIRATIAASSIRRQGKHEVIERVTASFGVAHLKPGESAVALVERADAALYAAKAAGRNRVTVSAAP